MAFLGRRGFESVCVCVSVFFSSFEGPPARILADVLLEGPQPFPELLLESVARQAPTLGFYAGEVLTWLGRVLLTLAWTFWDALPLFWHSPELSWSLKGIV